MKNYGRKGQALAVCPGETDCDKFQSAAGKTRKAKEKNVCHRCPLFITKTDEGKKGHTALERLARSAMDIRLERLTGYARKESLMLNTEFGALYVTEQIIEQEEIRLKSEASEMLMAVFGAKKE